MAAKINFAAVSVLVILAAAAVGKTDAATYVVGDSLGWTIPSSASVYSNWASQHTFHVGDILVFNFSTGFHDVAIVPKASYDGCTSSNPTALVTVGPARINLTSEGQAYFICTFGSHCSLGQKLTVDVKAAISSSPPPPTAAPAPKSTPPPATPPVSTPPPVPTPSTTPAPAPPTSAPTPAKTPAAPAPAPKTPAGPAPSPASVPSTSPAPTPAGGTTPSSAPSPNAGPGASPSPPSPPSPTPGPAGEGAVPPPSPSSAPATYTATILLVLLPFVIGIVC